MSQYLLKRIFLFLTFEGRLRSQQNIKNNSTTPQIAFICKVSFNNLRSHIAHCSNQFVTLHFRLSQLTSSPKIKQLNLNIISCSMVLHFFNKDHILQLDVSMNYTNSMKIVETSQQLLENRLNNMLVKLRTRFNKIYNWTPIAELCHHLVTIVPIEHLIQLNDVGVIHFFQQLQLSKHFFFFATG